MLNSAQAADFPNIMARPDIMSGRYGIKSPTLY